MGRISRFANLLQSKTKQQSSDVPKRDAGATSACPGFPPPDTVQYPAPQPADADVVAYADPWARAYEMVQDRERELMTDYRAHLGSSQNDAVGGPDLTTRQSVQSVVNSLLEDRERRQWRVSLLGNDIKIREQTEKLAKFLLWADPIIKSAAGAQPYAALAWSGVSLLLPLLTTATAQNEAMLTGLNSIGDLHLFWHICEETHLQSGHRRDYQYLIEPLAKLYSYIIEYQARVISHLSRSQASRAWQDIAGSADWAAKIREIDGLDKGCRDIIGVSQAEEIRKNRNNQLREMQELRIIQEDMLLTMKQNRQDELEVRLLRDLAIGAGDYERYKDVNPERVSGTCMWFLTDERFCEWRDCKSSSLLWASAGPGRGKSVLSRSLVDEGQLSAPTTTTITITASDISAFTSTKSAVCYFFFKDGGDGRMDGAQALCAVLHQLFTYPPTSGLIKHALAAHRNNGDTLNKKFSGLWRILEACAQSPDAGEIICVFDALDECRAESRPEIITALESFYSSRANLPRAPSRLKFLVTSRPYEDLEKSFIKFPATAAYLRFDSDDKSEQIAREIDLVIDAKVPDITAGFADVDQRKISEYLKSMEHRTYLWLHLTFNIIERSPSIYGKPSDVEYLLHSLPSDVAEAYENILGRNEAGSEEEIQKKEVWTETLLQIVLAAARPLSLDEVNVILTLTLQEASSHAALQSKCWPEANIKSVVTNLCRHFITVHGSKLFFIHQTAREFLINPKRQGKWQGRLHMAGAHSRISQSCLRYLLLPDINSHSNDQYPLLAYAAAYWPLHYASQGADGAEQARQSARMLCDVSGHNADIWAPAYLEQRDLHWGDWTDLILASYLGLQPVVEILLGEEKTHIDEKSGLYGTALNVASADGHNEVVQMLLEKGADANVEGTLYGSPLYQASASGHKNAVQMLLEAGATVDMNSRLFGTALYVASARGQQETVQTLLDGGATVDLSNCGYYGTALCAASSEGHKETVRILLGRGANVNMIVNVDGACSTVLYCASEEGHLEIVQMLLDAGAAIDMYGGYRGTALQGAVATGCEEIVQILLDNGADVNMQYDGCGTALQTASEHGHLEIVQVLLDAGAAIDTYGGHYGSPLQAAIATGREEIVRVLLDAGAAIDTYGGHYGSPLQAAIATGREGIVQVLLDAGAAIDTYGGHYGSPLQAAIATGREEIVQILLDSVADVNVHYEDCGTALQTASEHGRKEIVPMLLEKGADVNIDGGHNGTALYMAVERGHKEIVHLLLENGANVSTQHKDSGRTVLQVAWNYGHEEIRQMLLERGADASFEDENSRGTRARRSSG